MKYSVILSNEIKKIITNSLNAGRRRVKIGELVAFFGRTDPCATASSFSMIEFALSLQSNARRNSRFDPSVTAIAIASPVKRQSLHSHESVRVAAEPTDEVLSIVIYRNIIK